MENNQKQIPTPPAGPPVPEKPPEYNYLDWHFAVVPKRIWESLSNLLLFFRYYFSVGLLLKTFFSPWKRQAIVKKTPGFSIHETLEVLTFNLISRAIGAMARGFLLFGWFIITFLTFFLGAAGFLVWIILPCFTYPIYLLLESDHKKPMLCPETQPEELIRTLIKDSMGKFIFARLRIPSDDALNIQINPAFKQQFYTRIAQFLKNKGVEEETPPPHYLWEYLATQFPPFVDFLNQNHVNPQEFIKVVNWFNRHYQQKKKKSGTLQKEELLKIPPIGKNLVYGYTPELDRYCVDLSYPKPHYHHLVGRKQEIEQIEQVLSRSFGNNVILVGEPGVGRHTIIESFAKQIRDGEVNPSLAHKRILSFALRRVLSEEEVIEKAKGKLELILAEAAYAGNVILVIDNIDQYISIGPGRFDLTNILTKAVSKGVQIIGITSFANFAKYIYPNQEFLKQFEKVEATPPSRQEALTILEDTVELYEKRNKVFVTHQALREIINKVDKYIVHIPFPEKAIDLLDETCVYAAKNNITIITPELVNKVISIKTKIPLGKIQENEKEKLKNLEQFIHQRVIDQDEAVVAISRAMRRARTGITKKEKPIGSFLFMGPTGVGKTETAKALAEGYFGSEEQMIRFDMGEYQRQDALDRIIGSTQTHEPGLFARRIRENPFSLLLLDEIEKAHPDILNIFLTMLDEGFFTDAFGKKVICQNLIIIGTSNAGTELIRQKMDEGIDTKELEKQVVDYVQRQGIFSPEFINRFDAVVIYRPLSYENLKQVARLMLERLNQRLKEKEIKVKITDELLERIVTLGYNPAFGARPMNRVIQDKIEDQIAQCLLREELKKGDVVEMKI